MIMKGLYMNKINPLPFFTLFIFLIFTLTTCGSSNEKSSDFTIIYVITTIASLLLLIGYSCLIKKKDLWFCLLFSAVFIVNFGYLSLAISKTLEEALLANRIAYLGSVFLPLTMLMIIMNICKIKSNKIFSGLLFCISVIVFIFAASPGYSNIYYKKVSFKIEHGVSILEKEYGSWHKIYLFYLLIYFGLIILTIAYAIKTKKIHSGIQAGIIAAAVFVNISVWGLEQVIKLNFELLSITYIISELFLLCFNLLFQENKVLSFNELNNNSITDTTQPKDKDFNEVSETNTNKDGICVDKNCPNNTKKKEFISNEQQYFESQLKFLTPKELEIYEFYINGYKPKDIILQLNITENTLKYHNKNIYSKLGINSRKQLLEYANSIKESDTSQ